MLRQTPPNQSTCGLHFAAEVWDSFDRPTISYRLGLALNDYEKINRRIYLVLGNQCYCRPPDLREFPVALEIVLIKIINFKINNYK